jgi:hypothetical protein
MRVCIREYEDPVAADDSTRFASRVSRQASVAQRIHIPGADLLTHFEASLGVHLRSHKIAAKPGHGGYAGDGKRRRSFVDGTGTFAGPAAIQSTSHA